MNAKEMAEIDLKTGGIVETNPGDMILFHSFTPHFQRYFLLDKDKSDYYFL
ncbi:hypothetical protein AB4Z22_09810 [Paenibacillus sp. TAF58]